MTSRLAMMTINSATPGDLSRWWADHLGGTVVTDLEPHFFTLVPAEGSTNPMMGFQRVDEAPARSSRMHLDLDSDDRAGDVERFVASGATFVAEHTIPGLRWTILEDPESNVFCVTTPDETATDFS